MRILNWAEIEDPVHVTTPGSKSAYAYPTHLHEGYWELTIIRRGRLLHQINGVEHVQDPGCVALIRDGDSHGMHGIGVSFINIAVDGRLIEPLLALVLSTEVAAGLLAFEPLVGRLDAVSGELLERQCRIIDAATDRLSVVSAWLAVAGVVLHAILSPRLDHAGPDWLVAAIARLHEAHGPVTLATFRSWCGVSAEHVARTVRASCGMTPRELLEERRLQQAAGALSHAGVSVEDIARQAGFASARQLARRFRRRFGVVPSAWRCRPER